MATLLTKFGCAPLRKFDTVEEETLTFQTKNFFTIRTFEVILLICVMCLEELMFVAR
jgi:hypothetical protein